MLKENAITGLLFLIGLFIGSINMGIAALISVCTATLLAKLFKFEKSDIDKGLYGFNAALIGVAFILFCKPTLLIWCFIVVDSFLSTLVQHFFITKKITVFTLPFVLVTWTMLFIINHFFSEFMIAATSSNTFHDNDFGFAFRGYGQVIFQDNLWVGALFFVAVFISLPLAALYGLVGAFIAVLVAQPFIIPIENIHLGLVSYNAVLCAIGFAGNKLRDGVWVLFSVVLATLISLLMSTWSFLQLTFPFVAASITTLFLKNNIKPGEKINK